jgi:hypothetical protein
VLDDLKMTTDPGPPPPSPGAASTERRPPSRRRDNRFASSASSFYYDAAVRRYPDDGPDDQRLTGKRPEPIPDRRLERVAELVASDPPLDVNQLIAIESTQHDPVSATAAASPATEEDGGNRRAARLELLPDRLAAQELV